MRNIMVALTALAFAATGVTAQQPDPLPPALRQPVSVDAYAGGFSPQEPFVDGSRFGSSGAVGAAATFWLGRYMGLRGDFLYARPGFQDATSYSKLFTGAQARMYAVDANLVLRLPLHGMGSGAYWYPYALGGIGNQTYQFNVKGVSTDHAVMGDLGLGVAYRFSPDIGLRLEARDMQSKFVDWNLDHSQSDLVYDGGVTVDF